MAEHPTDRVLELTIRKAGATIQITVYGGLDADIVEVPVREDSIHRPTIDDIKAATCEVLGVRLDAVVGRSRRASAVWPRHLAMYLARDLTDATLPVIGESFGRDHSTVLHAIGQVQQRVAGGGGPYKDLRDVRRYLEEEGRSNRGQPTDEQLGERPHPPSVSSQIAHAQSVDRLGKDGSPEIAQGQDVDGSAER